MRIQYTERDKHIVQGLYNSLSRNSPLAEILQIALSYEGPPKDPVSIVSVKCSRCGVDVFGVNPCRDEIESSGWCGCKP